ncbi:hypothetical protein T07_3657 [Trichinella nelsoni]|uniref:Uncharacterized protein n=1 Tax=Trichinella nelsoni TaxID=6336 RepID=A0A0V0SF54_9BILA|nr:hypothetical protein T07_3657 [Trichinella nelsoni]
MGYCPAASSDSPPFGPGCIRGTTDPVSTSMSHLTPPTEPSTIGVSISGDRMMTTEKVRSVLLTLPACSSREEAWHSLLMWPSPPHVQQRKLPLFFSRRRRWGSDLFAAAGVLLVSSSFNCRTNSANSSPTSFRVVTAAAVASVTSTAGCLSSWSASALTEETLALSVVSSLQTRSSRAATSIASAKLSVPLRKTAILMASAESPALNCCSRILSAAPLSPGNAFGNSQRK